MTIRELVLKNRSYRRFDQDVAIEMQTLRELVDLARCSASGMNRQPLKYMLACEPEKNALIFPQLSWAGYLKDWSGPQEGERPAAYIVILGDKNIRESFGIDHGSRRRASCWARPSVDWAAVSSLRSARSNCGRP